MNKQFYVEGMEMKESFLFPSFNYFLLLEINKLLKRKTSVDQLHTGSSGERVVAACNSI
jgi:hypothetical protein